MRALVFRLHATGVGVARSWPAVLPGAVGGVWLKRVCRLEMTVPTLADLSPRREEGQGHG